jgi:hypothetical protein
VMSTGAPGEWVGRGLSSFDYGGLTVYEHTGSGYGFVSYMFIVPERDFAVVALYNANYGQQADVPFHALNAFLELDDPAHPGSTSSPSAPAADLAGTYIDSYALGEVVVTANGNSLTAHFTDLGGANKALTHARGNIFYVTLPNHARLGDYRGMSTRATFWLGAEGKGEFLSTGAGVARRATQ